MLVPGPVPGNGHLWILTLTNGNLTIANAGDSGNSAQNAQHQLLAGNRANGTVRLVAGPQSGNGHLWRSVGIQSTEVHISPITAGSQPQTITCSSGDWIEDTIPSFSGLVRGWGSCHNCSADTLFAGVNQPSTLGVDLKAGDCHLRPDSNVTFRPDGTGSYDIYANTEAHDPDADSTTDFWHLGFGLNGQSIDAGGCNVSGKNKWKHCTGNFNYNPSVAAGSGTLTWSGCC
jgi:hypothetical protein